ncbi:MAG: zinc carboxypeptidase [Myxococcales bacterium]|nr:zinc carboxypeptidase [Myxococcales bacterium]
MKRTLLSLIALSLLLFAAAAQADFFGERTYLRIEAPSVEDRTVLANLGFSIDYVNLEEGYLTAWVPNDLLPKIKELGFLYESPVVDTKDFPANYAPYHNYNEQLTALQDLNTQHPEITDLFTFGQTVEGRNLWCLKISANPLQDDPSLPAVVIVAEHHAREILTPEVALYTATQLVEGYGTDEKMTAYVDNHEIYVITTLNPDGSLFDIQGGSFHMWRKNRQVNAGSACLGVDLNRNYGYKWGGVGSSGMACADTYHGTAAFSEPETAALRDLVNAHANITTILSLHSHAKLVLYPFGYTYEHIADQIDYYTHKTLAEYMAAETKFTPTQSSGLYLTTGDTMDWAYGVKGIISFTFELGPSQLDVTGFYPKPSFIEPSCQAAFNAIDVLIGFSSEPSYVLATNVWKFTAEYKAPDAAVLKWASVRETRPQGWKVLRAETEDGDYQAVNDGFIQPNQAAYEYTDEGLEAGQTYYYLLHYEGTGQNDVDFGPVSVEVPGADDDDASPADDDDNDDNDSADSGTADDDDNDDEGGCGC